MPKSSYPEHDKLDAVNTKVEAVTEFIETGGFILAKYPENEERLMPVHQNAHTIALEHFEIDPKKIEAERRTMLTKIRNT